MILKVSASMLEHRQPFELLCETRGNDLVDEPRLRIARVSAGLLLLQSTFAPPLQEALGSEIGLELPAPLAASVCGDYTVLWLTPAEWLLELPANKTESLRNALTQRLATSLAVVTDMSDAFACCEVSGTRAAEIMMSGCSLDLRTQAFPARRVARTALADIPVIIWNPGGEPQRLRCLIDRSFAGHLRDWLVDAAGAQKPPSTHQV